MLHKGNGWNSIKSRQFSYRPYLEAQRGSTVDDAGRLCMENGGAFAHQAKKVVI